MCRRISDCDSRNMDLQIPKNTSKSIEDLKRVRETKYLKDPVISACLSN